MTKAEIPIKIVEEFLQSKQITFLDLQFISGGKHSQAFSYKTDGKDFIIRFNENSKVFYKDLNAYKDFSSPQIPIPKIYEIGNYNEELFFCISEKVFGQTPKIQYSQNDFSSIALQLEMIEKIAKIQPNFSNSDSWFEYNINSTKTFNTFKDYFQDLVEEIYKKEIFQKLDYFDENFMNYLIDKTNYYSYFLPPKSEFTHADFGNDNLFILDNKIAGIIDWEKFGMLTKFIDVGRVVLFCPNRKETTSEAIKFYSNLEEQDYKEKIRFGVYYAMFKNYISALMDNKKDSCIVYPDRIKEFEDLMKISL